MKHLKLFEDIYGDELEYHMSEIKDLFQSVIDDYDMYEIESGIFDPASLKINNIYYKLQADWYNKFSGTRSVIKSTKIDIPKTTSSSNSKNIRLIIVNRNDDFNENLSLDIDNFIKRIESIGYKTYSEVDDIEERVFQSFKYKKSTGYFIDIIIDFSNLSNT